MCVSLFRLDWTGLGESVRDFWFGFGCGCIPVCFCGFSGYSGTCTGGLNVFFVRQKEQKRCVKDMTGLTMVYW